MSRPTIASLRAELARVSAERDRYRAALESVREAPGVPAAVVAAVDDALAPPPAPAAAAETNGAGTRAARSPRKRARISPRAVRPPPSPSSPHATRTFGALCRAAPVPALLAVAHESAQEIRAALPRLDVGASTRLGAVAGRLEIAALAVEESQAAPPRAPARERSVPALARRRCRRRAPRVSVVARHAAGLRREAEHLEALAALADALHRPRLARLRRAQAEARRVALARIEARS